MYYFQKHVTRYSDNDVTLTGLHKLAFAEDEADSENFDVCR